VFYATTDTAQPPVAVVLRRFTSAVSETVVAGGLAPNATFYVTVQAGLWLCAAAAAAAVAVVVVVFMLVVL
jgi:hypothetical protein